MTSQQTDCLVWLELIWVILRAERASLVYRKLSASLPPAGGSVNTICLMAEIHEKISLTPSR